MAGAGAQANIHLPMAAIEAFCRKWQIIELALFGSVLRDFLAMHEELEQLVGRRVDIVNRESLERSANYIRRKAILDSARMIYVA